MLDCVPVFIFVLFSVSQCLLEAHDMVASKCYEVPPPTETTNDAAVNSALMQADAVRMIGIRKKAGEPLVSRKGQRVCVCVSLEEKQTRETKWTAGEGQ